MQETMKMDLLGLQPRPMADLTTPQNPLASGDDKKGHCCHTSDRLPYNKDVGTYMRSAADPETHF